MKTRWSVLGVCVVIGGGCLSDAGRRVAEDSTGSDTAQPDTGNGDVVGTDAADTPDTPDTIGWEADVGPDVVSCGDCNDDDPCTYDRCDPETGLCEHLGYPGASEAPGDAAVVAPECFGDQDCDDGDPCTTNTCVELANECRPPTAICVYEPIVGCVEPCDNSAGACNDGNPCTTDVCMGDGSCDHWPEEGCVPQCTREGIVAIGDLMSQPPPGQRVKTRGVVAPRTLLQACDDGPDCGCVGETALWGDGRELPIGPALDGSGGGGGGGVPMPPEPADQAAWQCTTTGCVELAVQCQPVEEGVVYRVWGTALDGSGVVPAGAIPRDPVPPLPPVERMAVEGFCLDTEPASLTGKYTGVLELEPGVEIGFTASMLAVDQGVIVTMSAAACLSRTCNDADVTSFVQDAVLYEGDGRIGFDFLVPLATGGMQAHARLYSNGSRFVGRWGPGSMPQGIALPAIGGKLELTRMGTGALPDATEP